MNLEQELTEQELLLEIEHHWKLRYMRQGIIAYLNATIKAQKEISVPLFKLYYNAI